MTDGLRIAETDRDGSYELVTDGCKPFVYITISAGYKIPTNPTGTVRFYERIETDRQGEASISFELEQRVVDGQNLHFLLLANPQTQNDYEVERFHFETVPDILNLVQGFSDKPVFGLGCGDLMFDNLELLPEYEKAVDNMGMAFMKHAAVNFAGTINRPDLIWVINYVHMRGEAIPRLQMKL